MEDGFRFSIPARPEGTPITGDELERLLRARVAESPEGSGEHAAALWQLMRLMSMTGRQTEGLEILDALLGSAADLATRAEITLAMGQLMEGLGDFKAASATYSRGVTLEPIDPLVCYFLHNNLGYSLNQMGDHIAAERWCRAAIQIDPQRFNAHKNLGVACQAQGSYVEAARSFIRAAHCEASDPRAAIHLRALLEAHPEIAIDIPDIREQLESCVMAIGAAKIVLKQQISGKPPNAESN
jgi:Flp pilus assembly protein TadD